MKIIKLSLFVILCSLEVNGETPPNYYEIYGEEKRLSYVDYDMLMDNCMKPIHATNTPDTSSVYVAMVKVCNKMLDQVKYPETFVGKIPGQ